MESRADQIEVQPLKLSELSLDEGDVLCVPRAALVSDGHLVVVCSGDRFFRVFKLPLTQNSFTAIRKGRGPGEIFDLDYKSIIPVRGGFRFVDGQGVRTGIIRGEKVILSPPKTSLHATATKNGIIKVKGGYVDMNTAGEEEFVLYNETFTSKKRVGKWPKWDKTGTILPVFSYVKFMASSPDEKMFVSAYARFPKIRIFDNEVRMKKEVTLNFDNAPLNPDSRYYVCKPCVNDKHIYLLSRKGSVNSKTSEIQVIDWSGKLIGRYGIDIPASFFTIDFKTGMLYVFSSDSPNKIYYASLSMPRVL